MKKALFILTTLVSFSAFAEDYCASQDSDTVLIFENAEDFWKKAFTHLTVLEGHDEISSQPVAAIGFGQYKRKKTSYKYAQIGLKIDGKFQIAKFVIFSTGKKEVQVGNDVFACVPTANR